MDGLKITFLGTGTSMGVPVIACDCDVCQSLDAKDKRLRSSILVESKETTFCVDSGPDFRAQMLSHKVKKLDALVYTHEHKDHTAGMDDVRAYNFIQRKPMILYATERVEKALRQDFHYAFADTKYPGVPDIRFHSIETDTFDVGDILVQPLPVMHHKLPVLGFRMGDFSYITDANYIPDATWELLKGTKILVLNALRKTNHISHFTLEEAIQISEMIGAESTYLTHISHQMGKHVEVSKELPDSIHIAFDGLVLSA